MEVYFAPMEGITSVSLRMLHARFFGGCDKYFTPFISTNDSVKLNGREKEDVDPENSKDYRLIPQIISNDAHQSTLYIKLLREKYSYDEININMGCPSGTVTAKSKGSGMIRNTDFLDEYLERLFDETDKLKAEGFDVPDITVKTRIGYYSEDEYRDILNVFLRYPVKQYIIHPRTRKEFYGGSVHMDVFSVMYDELKKTGAGVCYNGDIKSVSDFESIADKYPGLDAVMIGRGILTDPFLARKIKGGEGAVREEYLEYMESLLDIYSEKIGNDKFVLAKMKDLWNFAVNAFCGNEKGYKEMCKAVSVESYRVCMRQFIRNSDLKI